MAGQLPHRMGSLSDVALSESGCLYLLRFDNGVIKAGYTTDLATRSSRHASDSGRYDLQIVDRWNSERISNVRSWERHLLEVFARIGTRTAKGREYFRDIPFSIARYQAENLRKTLRHRCCCGNCVDPVDVRLPVRVVGIRPTPVVFELELDCGAVVAAEFCDHDVEPGGEYAFSIDDELIVEMSPVAEDVRTAYICEMPNRLK